MRDIVHTTIEKNQKMSNEISRIKSEVKSYYYYLVDKSKNSGDLKTKEILMKIVKKLQLQLSPIDNLDSEVKLHLELLKNKDLDQVTDYKIAKELDGFSGRKNRICYNFTLIKKELKEALNIKEARIFTEESVIS